jgi:hypothetical protein
MKFPFNIDMNTLCTLILMNLLNTLFHQLDLISPPLRIVKLSLISMTKSAKSHVYNKLSKTIYSCFLKIYLTFLVHKIHNIINDLY